MRKLLNLGCALLIAFVVGAGVLMIVVANQTPSPQPQQVTGTPASTPPPAKAGAPQLGQVGQTVSLRGWEVTLLDFGAYDRFSPGKPPATKAQGSLLVADMRIKNLQNSTSNFTSSDFVLKALDGREFKPAGQTGSIERGFLISQTVQPGLVTENRVVFDVDPAVKDFTLTALGVQFSVGAP